MKINHWYKLMTTIAVIWAIICAAWLLMYPPAKESWTMLILASTWIAGPALWFATENLYIANKTLGDESCSDLERHMLYQDTAKTIWLAIAGIILFHMQQ